MRFAVPMAVLMSLWAASASGQLYRWVDPETGSVKFSSYPPPWYGDEAKQRRAPKVEVIPAGRDTGAGTQASTAAQEGAKRLEGLEAQRKVLLQQLLKPGTERGNPALQKQLEAYSALAEQMDKLDPMGSGTRRTEMQVLIDRIMKGETR